MEKKNVFDFENENYSLTKAIELVRTNPTYALWFTEQLSDYDIARVILKAWDKAMENKYEK